MWYRKNVGSRERIGRLVAGGLMIAGGLLGLNASLWGMLVAATGVFTILTGAVGYCPACAVAGRKPLAKE